MFICNLGEKVGRLLKFNSMRDSSFNVLYLFLFILFLFLFGAIALLTILLLLNVFRRDVIPQPLPSVVHSKRHDQPINVPAYLQIYQTLWE